MNAPAILPNSYHSSQTDTVAQTDTHGSSEQTIHTETCRITETTMRMEHKSPLPDIEFNPSPRPFETRHRFAYETKPHTEVVSLQQPLPTPQQHHEYADQEHLVAAKTFGNLKYTTFETATAPQGAQFGQEIAEEVLPTTKYGSVSDRVKTLEKSSIEEHSPVKSVPIWNAPIESPTQYIFEKHRYQGFSTPTHQMNGTSTPNVVNETIEQISSKMQEYERFHTIHGYDYDLKAPALVKHVTPIAKPFTNGYQSEDVLKTTTLNLQPGKPPEICYAPRSTSERRESLVEKIEKSLEKDLERGPSKVLPHSVRMMPPSPQTVSTDMYESKRSIMKQTTQNYINHQHTDFNHVKNIFYEHNKPLPRNTTVPTLTPTKAPKKVRN